MELRSRGTVTLDYELDFPAASYLELRLYADGANAFPHLLRDSRPWGVVRRVGILDIATDRYEEILDLLSLTQLTDETVGGLEVEYGRACRILDHLNDTDCRMAPNTLYRAMSGLMAFHVLNWAVPFADIDSLFCELLGNAEGRDALLSLLSPLGKSHVLKEAEAAGIATDVVVAAGWRSNEQASRRRLVELQLLKAAHSGETLSLASRCIRLCRLAADAEEYRRRSQNSFLSRFADTVMPTSQSESDCRVRASALSIYSRGYGRTH